MRPGPDVAHPYLERLQELSSVVEFDDIDLICKHFFSGAALYANAGLCALLSPDGLAFKLPQRRCADLIGCQAAIPLCGSGNAPGGNGYVLFPDPDDLSEQALSGYFRECIENALVQAP
jgi:hypothetical protein